MTGESSGLALAAGSFCAAQAGERVAELGGNAVDAAIAASIVAAITEPGVAALGGGAYLTIWVPGEDPITIDGNVEMPGREGIPENPDLEAVDMGYGGGVRTMVGHASVGTPGAIAACGLAREKFGCLPWATLLEPAIDVAKSGFPLSEASWSYLQYSAEPIFSRSETGKKVLFAADGSLHPAGSTIFQPALAASLATLAQQGPECFYTGALGGKIAQDVMRSRGLLSATDLASYKPIERESVLVELGDWVIASNPPPAAGGTILAAMLLLLKNRAAKEETSASLLLPIQRDAIGLRHTLAREPDSAEVAHCYLEQLARGASAPNTVHVSAVDRNGLACAITWSAGYGSGLMPGGAGIWLNNSLGEIELNRRGLLADPPGTRVPSNMAPTIARNKNGSVLAIGSPGAERITTALLYTLYYVIFESLELGEAIGQPRAHVEISGEDYSVACEPDADCGDTDMPLRLFGKRDMFFGGVTAAAKLADGTLTAAADPRRTGATLIR